MFPAHMLRLFNVKTYYSINPLIWHKCNWRGARLLNILDYQTLPILTKFVTGSFFVTSQPAIRACTLVSYFHLKDYAFVTFVGPVMDFP